jgi:hypothetical protein
MTTASASAGFQRRLFAVFSAATDAKEAAVWPEGKEASVGGGISRETPGLTAKGRIRPMSGLRARLQNRRSRTNPQATQVPSFLVFGIASRIAASKIHTSPWSQIRLTGTMTASRTPQRR